MRIFMTQKFCITFNLAPWGLMRLCMLVWNINLGLVDLGEILKTYWGVDWGQFMHEFFKSQFIWQILQVDLLSFMPLLNFKFSSPPIFVNQNLIIIVLLTKKHLTEFEDNHWLKYSNYPFQTSRLITVRIQRDKNEEGYNYHMSSIDVIRFR